MGDNAKARELALKAKTYKIFAKVFALAGLLLMAFLFYQQSGGDYMQVLKSPSSAALMLLSFVPAMIFISISAKAEKQLKKTLEEGAKSPAPAKEKEATPQQPDKKTKTAGK